MKEKLKIYVVHYSKLVERKKYMDSLLKDIGIDHQYIDNFDKENLKEINLNKYYKDNKNEFLKKVQLWGKRAINYTKLTPEEISCTIKHVQALHEIKNNDYEYGLILEDDVIPKIDNFLQELNKYISKNNKWDVLLIGEGMGKSFRDSKIGLKRYNPFKNIFKIKHPATNCLEAYIVKKSIVEDILEELLPFNLAADWELAYQFYKKDLNIYWTKKPIFSQGSKNGTYKSELR